MNDPGFLHLLVEDTRPRFTLTGLVWRGDGALTLAPVPLSEGAFTPSLTPAATFTGAAGIGMDAAGNLFIADPAGNRVLRWDAYSEETAPLSCLGGEGVLPGRLRTPRGVLAGPRGSLYVIDSGNHRVQVVDLRTGQLRGVWGQADPYAEPEPGDLPGRLDDPWDLTADRAGYLYVVDHGNRRVQKFDGGGRALPSFWDTVRAQPRVPVEPVGITTVLLDGEERLAVLDRVPARLLIYRTDGTLDTPGTERWESLLSQESAAVTQPAGVAISESAVYVGDAGGQRVMAFDREGRYLGAARGYSGPVAGLRLDCRGRLLAHPGAGAPLTRLLPEQAYVERGGFVAGPFEAGARPASWSSLQVQAAPLPAEAHTRFFTLTGNTDSAPPPLPSPPPNVTDDDALTGAGVWRAAPPDGLDLLVLHQPARYLWVAGTLRGDGGTSPALHQIRVTYDHDGWLRYLPAVYRRNGADRVFLERSLALFESMLADDERLIDDLPRLFDVWAAADDDPPRSGLDWLAGWLGFELDEAWTQEQRRARLAEAFLLHSRRGTVEGLRRFIALYAGATARIDEPGRFAAPWRLGETSLLGFTTTLAPAEAQGAVVGTTATVNRSHLIQEDDYGAPLFEEIAHQFCVRVYAAQVSTPAALANVRRIVEQEKPAHTTYHLCRIEPRMRVGFQARVGIDAIVGGPPPELVLNGGLPLGVDTVLPGANQPPVGGRIGRDARVGRDARLA